MALSIKNEQAEKLARDLAERTGENITQVIIHALEDRLQRISGCRKSTDITQEIIAISNHCRTLPDVDHRSPDDIIGYDENGALASW